MRKLYGAVLIAMSFMSASLPVATGGIKGTVLYWTAAGTKPDTGAAVYVVAGTIPSPRPDEMFVSVAGKLLRISQPCLKNPACEYPLVQETAVDGSGNFEVSELGAGQYTVLIVSDHTEGPQFNKRTWSSVVTVADGAIKVLTVKF